MEPRLNSLAVLLALVLILPLVFVSGTQSSPTSPSLLSFALIVPKDFDLSYTIEDYNSTNQLVHECELGFHSTGAADFAETWHGPGPLPPINSSAFLGQEFVGYLRNAMNDDELCSLNVTYNDAGWNHIGYWKNVEEVAIHTPCGMRTLKFYGNAMIGILPNTYVALQKIADRIYSPSTDVLNISVEVSAQVDSDATLSMSTTLRNNAAHNVPMAGCTKDVWPAMIVRCNGCTIANLDYDIMTECIETVANGTTYEFNPHTWNATGLAVGKYVVMATPYLWGVTVFNVTGDLGHVNQAPRAFLQVSEPTDSNHKTYAFDASECCDEEDRVTDLQVRWDWYSDGTWDTSWSSEKIVNHTFANMTGYNLTIEVKDSEGLVTSASYGMGVSHSTIFTPLNALFLAILAVVVAVALLLLFRRKG
jgi:hypothetical protein